MLPRSRYRESWGFPQGAVAQIPRSRGHFPENTPFQLHQHPRRKSQDIPWGQNSDTLGAFSDGIGDMTWGYQGVRAGEGANVSQVLVVAGR